MCGRYGLTGDHAGMLDAFDIKADLRRDIDWKSLMPRYNVAPTDQVPVIFQKDGDRVMEPMRWGLIPFRTSNMRGRTVLSEQGKSINTPINARAETVDSNGIFKRSFERRRCIIPCGGVLRVEEARRLKGAVLDSPGGQEVDGLCRSVHLVEVARGTMGPLEHDYHDFGQRIHRAGPRQDAGDTDRRCLSHLAGPRG